MILPWVQINQCLQGLREYTLHSLRDPTSSSQPRSPQTQKPLPKCYKAIVTLVQKEVVFFLFNFFFLTEGQLGVLRFQLMSRYSANQSPSAINSLCFSLVTLLHSLNLNIPFWETVNYQP